MFKIFIFLLVFTLSLGETIPQVVISATPNTVGFSLIEYNFNIYNLPSSIPSDGGLKIIFPSTFLVPSSLNIIPFQGLGSKTTPILTINGNTLTITNGAPYSQTKISFVVFQEDEDKQGIIPLTNQTGFIQVSTIQANGSLIDSNSSIPISILPSNFISLELSSSNPLTSVVSTLVINMSLIDYLTPNATLIVKLPLINPQAPQSLQRNLIYNSNLISCTRKGEDGNKRLRFTVSGNQITITNAFKDSSYSQLIVEISNIVNPYSLSELSGFEIYLQSQFGGYVFQETNAGLKVSQPSRPKSIKIIAGEKTVGQPTNFAIEIHPMNFFNPNDIVEIIFPPSFDLDKFNSTLQVQGLSGSLDFAITGKDILSLPNIISNYTEDFIKIQISGLSNINYQVKQETFGIAIKSFHGDLVAQQLWDLPYTIIPGNLTLVEFTASNNTVDALSNYQISFFIQTNLNQGNIEIIFPNAYPKFEYDDVSCEFLENINSNAICSFSENTVKIIDAFPLSNEAEKIGFIFKNVVNPPFVIESEEFVIKTTTTINNYTVDSLNEIHMNFTSKEIVIESFEFLSNETSAPHGISLRLNIPNAKIPNNSLVELKLDDSISIDRSQFSCFGKCLINSNNSIIFINPSQDAVEIHISSGLSNLRPAEPECLMDIIIKTFDGFTIAQTNNSSVCFESESTPEIGRISLMPIIPNPDVETNYILEFKTPFALKTLDQIYIDFPNSEATDPTLFIAGSEMENTILEFQGNELFLQIEQNCNYSDTVQIILPNISSPWISQRDILNITLKSEDQKILAKQSLTEEKMLLLSDHALILPNFEIAFSSLLVGDVTTLKMKFQSQRAIQTSDSILLKIPQDFKITSLVINCLIENNSAISLTCKASQTVITMSQFSQTLAAGLEYTIIISPSIQNPLNNTKSSFYFLMDVVDSKDVGSSFGTYYLQSNFLCDSNCKSCRENSAKCFECNQGKFLFEDSCLTKCPDSYFEESNQCKKCSLNNCEKCFNSTFCAKCQDNYQTSGKDGGICILDQTPASGIHQGSEIIKRYLIPLVFTICLLTTIGLKWLFRKNSSRFFFNMTIFMNIFQPLLLVWLLVETAQKSFLLPSTIFYGCSVFLMLIQQLVFFRLLKGTQIRSFILKVLIRFYNYKIGLYHYLEKNPLMIMMIGLIFDGALMLIIAVVSGSEAILNFKDNMTEFIFLLEAGCFALILGLLEIYLAVSEANKLLASQNNGTENTMNEIDKSTLNNLRSRTYISKANEEKTISDSSIFDLSTFRLKRDIQAEAEITSNEISFRVKSANRNNTVVTPRKSKPQHSVHYFSESIWKTAREKSIEEISFFSANY